MARQNRSAGKVLKPVWPNAGIATSYRLRLHRLIDEMARSYLWWLRAAYRVDPPVMALDHGGGVAGSPSGSPILFIHEGIGGAAAAMAWDASPAVNLRNAVNALGRRWQRDFNNAAPKLARWFAQSAGKRSQAALRKILKDAGITVEFKTTAAVNDILQATVAENVALIRSIASDYHSQVQGLVMRSVTAGRDLEQLSKDLRKRYGVSRRRAALIARDQNNKATAAIQRVRQVELGITEAVWLHSHAGKKPRPTHVANDGKRYDPAIGWFDPDPRVRRPIFPGELINCRCVSKPVVKGFT